MSVSHITFDRNTPYGQTLRKALDQFEVGFLTLQELRNTMVQMEDTGVFTTYAVAKFGTTDVAGMTALFGELDACLAKLTTDGSVSSVFAAINQLLARLR